MLFYKYTFVQLKQLLVSVSSTPIVQLIVDTKNGTRRVFDIEGQSILLRDLILFISLFPYHKSI